jgi:hypothetical protein
MVDIGLRVISFEHEVWVCLFGNHSPFDHALEFPEVSESSNNGMRTVIEMTIGLAPEMNPAANGRAIPVYLLVTWTVSSLFYFLIIKSAGTNAASGAYISGLMWCPVIGAWLTCKYLGRKPDPDCRWPYAVLRSRPIVQTFGYRPLFHGCHQLSMQTAPRLYG